MHRREFLISTGAAALAAAGCGHRRGPAAGAVAGGWRGYAREIVIDALGGPIQFNIPQEGLPLRPAVHEAVRASGIGTDQGMVPLDVTGDFAARFQQVSAQRSAAGIAAPREDTILFVPELNTPRRMALLAGRLSARGQTGRVIEKVLGGNWMRLSGDVWR